MKKLVLLFGPAWLFLAVTVAQAQDIETVTFRFVPGDDMFYIRQNEPVPENAGQLDELFSLVEQYRSQITSGEIPVYVDGYSGTKTLSFVRANRVKTELILRKGLVEDNFVTNNYAAPYTAPDGAVHKDIVLVRLRIPVQPKPEPAPQPEPTVCEPPAPQPEPVYEPEPTPVPEPMEAVKVLPPPYRFAVRTNLLYDGFGLPTLGLEWRVNRHVGIKLDGSRSWWGDAHGKVQKIWLISPEVRWYLLDAKRFYVGASANLGKYNVYKYPVGGIFSSDTGYQGKLWNAGVTVGYQLYLCRCLSLDFNVGLGYNHSKYDSFTVEDGERVYKDRDKTKTLWGPTQAGVSLVWTIGGDRK